MKVYVLLLFSYYTKFHGEIKKNFKCWKQVHIDLVYHPKGVYKTSLQYHMLSRSILSRFREIWALISEYFLYISAGSLFLIS